jgi:hypothetical protein
VTDQSQIENAAEECREARHRQEAGQVMPVVAPHHGVPAASMADGKENW